jgi:hypothetical protein
VSKEHPMREMFIAQQKVMAAKLEEERATHDHTTALGDASENVWVTTLRSFLPLRYQVAKAFVLDSRGNKSQQFDVVIYDQQYSPLLSKSTGGKYVPAESVYAVFEVKQDLDRGHVLYAGEKVASVRKLERTSASFSHLGGKASADRPLPYILGGLLALHTDWTPPFGEPFIKVLGELSRDQQLELGCSIDAGGYEISYDGSTPTVRASPSDIALSYFLFRLLHRLQQLGTAHALDFDAYTNGLEQVIKVDPPTPRPAPSAERAAVARARVGRRGTSNRRRKPGKGR